MLVSVVMPVYGMPDKLEESIESVLGQTYASLELIIVDDNGKGTSNQLETEKLVLNYGSDQRLRYIVHDIRRNGSAARNTGISVSRGSYIALLDDDDLFMPDKLIKQVKVMDAMTVENKACYTSFTVIYPDGRERDVIASASEDISLDMLRQEIEIPSSSLMFSRCAWDKVSGFDESFNRHQDWEFITRLGRVCEFKFIEEVLVHKRICRRNSPANATVFSDYREHFLNKMSPIIDLYGSGEGRKINYVHMVSVAYAYLKEGNFNSGFRYLLKSGRPLRGSVRIGMNIVSYLKSSLKKSKTT